MNINNMSRRLKLSNIAFCIQICVLTYALLSTVGIIPSLTYQYVYPFFRDVFSIAFFPLTFSEISFEGQALFLSPVAIASVIFLHFIDVFLYISISSSILNLASILIIRHRLGGRGLKKLRSMQAISDKRRLDNVEAVRDSYANITLINKRSIRQNQDSGKFGSGVLVGLLLGSFFW